MSILIKGMEMPKRGESCLIITITPDGEVYKNVYDASFRVNQLGEAVPVPPHGRLMDADAYIAYCGDKWIPLNIDAVNAQPTIILAEKTSTENINIPITDDLLQEESGTGTT